MFNILCSFHLCVLQPVFFSDFISTNRKKAENQKLKFHEQFDHLFSQCRVLVYNHKSLCTFWHDPSRQCQ